MIYEDIQLEDLLYPWLADDPMEDKTIELDIDYEDSWENNEDCNEMWGD